MNVTTERLEEARRKVLMDVGDMFAREDYRTELACAGMHAIACVQTDLLRLLPIDRPGNKQWLEIEALQTILFCPSPRIAIKVGVDLDLGVYVWQWDYRNVGRYWMVLAPDITTSALAGWRLRAGLRAEAVVSSQKKMVRNKDAPLPEEDS